MSFLYFFISSEHFLRSLSKPSLDLLALSIAKYWLGAATSGKFNLTIMYHVFGKK